MTRYLWLTVAAGCLLPTHATAWAETISEIVKSAKPAVVEIVALNRKGSPKKFGTGFFISSDGQLITNRHVIKGAGSLVAFDSLGARLIAHSYDPPNADKTLVAFAHSVGRPPLTPLSPPDCAGPALFSLARFPFLPASSFCPRHFNMCLTERLPKASLQDVWVIAQRRTGYLKLLDFPTLINLPSLLVAENHVTTTAFRPLRNSHSLGDSCLTGFSVRIGNFEFLEGYLLVLAKKTEPVTCNCFLLNLCAASGLITSTSIGPPTVRSLA
jgi:hypothetical protein